MFSAIPGDGDEMKWETLRAQVREGKSDGGRWKVPVSGSLTFCLHPSLIVSVGLGKPITSQPLSVRARTVTMVVTPIT